MKFVTAEKQITTKHPKHGEIKVTVETPQAESYSDFETFAGGADKALEFVNSALDTAAKNAARAYMRQAPETASVEQITTKAQELSRGYSVQSTGRGSAGREAQNKVDTALTALKSGKELTRDELIALLEGKAA